MTAISEKRSYAQIMRVDGRRVANVTADVDEQLTTPQEVLNVVMNRIVPALRQDYLLPIMIRIVNDLRPRFLNTSQKE